ncbi:hypothetical protein [Chitinimonas sp. BJB300]|uniref:hypothetical protein n=1 Tax=Chitinimonas sp. BJB300 TaxID=1559339 RepID=UPI000C11A7C1|nr:hypothetical protein [Chitinimonas sp. BJB300]PHV10530.1 hypothetical protein CSQ89_15710 [Chitinimonas sp. BJB300]TSJ85224.1 hypothetical protein FG002_018160 [Chitinimonas sp. BJB300]
MKEVHRRELVSRSRLLIHCQSFSRYPKQRGKQFIRVGSVAKDVTDVAYFDNLKVTVTYQPDKKSWPEFVVENQA